MTPVVPWVNDPPSPPAGYLAPLTDTAQAHGWRNCPGCGDGFRCRDCGHYRHDTNPDDGYRCGHCVAFEKGSVKLVAFISEALSTGTGIAAGTVSLVAFISKAFSTGTGLVADRAAS